MLCIVLPIFIQRFCVIVLFGISDLDQLAYQG